MAVEVNHTPFFVTFTGSSDDLTPIIAQLREAAISFEHTEEKITVDLQVQGEGQTAIQKGAFVLDLVDLYSAADREV